MAETAEGSAWSSETDLVNQESSQNIKVIVCQICGSVILKDNTCSYNELTFPLPFMKAKDKDGKSLVDQVEDVKKFWLVNDMMTFENVGFTKTVNGLKYLICADCEIGPIGYQDTKNVKNLYVAVDRVKYR